MDNDLILFADGQIHAIDTIATSLDEQFKYQDAEVVYLMREIHSACFRARAVLEKRKARYASRQS